MFLVLFFSPYLASRLKSSNILSYDHLLKFTAHALRSRLRAPKRSPVINPNGQNGYFEPFPSPSGEIISPTSPKTGPRPLYLSQPFVKAALVKGSFKTIVAPPKYVDVNEWVAINCESCLGIKAGLELSITCVSAH